MAINEIFVLVLQLDHYQKTTLVDHEICGRKIADWVKIAVAPFQHQFIDASTQDDIITLFKQNLHDAKYTVITYADMPLLTTDSILAAVEYAQHKNVHAVKLPRGWVFNTQQVANNDTFKVDEYLNANQDDYLVAFNNQQVAKIRAVMQERINDNLIKNGVEILDPSHTYIDATVRIAAGCVIEPNVHIIGNTNIDANTTILDGCRITDAVIGKDNLIGPYAHIRPTSCIGDNCRIGNYVEIKRSRLGNNTKVAHMSYVGDSTLGTDCNVGCGVIFCNYNGKIKSNCLIGNHVFIGSNSCLVAPLDIGDYAYIAAGSVITDRVPKRALGIARARQAIKENYVTE